MSTGQLGGETVQGSPLRLQMPAEAGSLVAGVQPQVPQGCGGQPLVTQASRLMLQMPSDVPSVVEGVQLQSPQACGQLFARTVQDSPLVLQMPALLPSLRSGVQLQVPQGGGTTGQLFAATVQGWDGKPVQEAPPHPADSAWLLDCVPALDASVVDGVQLQAPQDPH